MTYFSYSFGKSANHQHPTGGFALLFLPILTKNRPKRNKLPLNPMKCWNFDETTTFPCRGIYLTFLRSIFFIFLIERRKWKSPEYPSVVSEQVCPVRSWSWAGVRGLHQRCEEQHARTPDIRKSHHEWVWSDGWTIPYSLQSTSVALLRSDWCKISVTFGESFFTLETSHINHLIRPLFAFTLQVCKATCGNQEIYFKICFYMTVNLEPRIDRTNLKTHQSLELSGVILGLDAFILTLNRVERGSPNGTSWRKQKHIIMTGLKQGLGNPRWHCTASVDIFRPLLRF